jgi:hypothetical protein
MVNECLQAMIASEPIQHGLLSRFNGIELTDSTVITLPNALADTWQGAGGYGTKASKAGMKISVRWNASNGQLCHIDVTSSITHDRRVPAHDAPVAEGSLQLRDLGYFKLDDLASLDEQGAYFITRYKTNVTILTTTRQKIDLVDWLPQRVGQRLDHPVLVGMKDQVPMRLVAERVPPAVVQQRHERIKETARQNQQPPSERSLALAQWTIYLTNVPSTQLSPDELFLLGRYRWQIELLFKLWKSQLGIDKWQTSNPLRILCEIFAKLIVAIVTNWLLLIACWQNPHRSLTQAMPTIRGLAWQWANSIHSLPLLIHMLLSLQRALSVCRMERSQQHPRICHLLAYEFS